MIAFEVFFNRTRPAFGLPMISLLVLFGMFGCSSAPKELPDTMEARRKATEYAQSGANYYARADYVSALQFFQLALQEHTRIDNLSGMADARDSIGTVYLAVGERDAAVDSFERALKLAQQADDTRLIAKAYTSMGEAKLHDDDNQAALEYFETARSVLTSAGLELDPILRHNQGTVLARLGRFDEAIVEFEAARELNEAAGAWSELAGNLYMLSSVASRQGDTVTALRYMETALEYDKRAENSAGIATDLLGLGRISKRQGDANKAYDYYLRALRVALASGIVSTAVESLSLLVDVAVELGRTEEAAQFALERDRILAELPATNQ